MSQEAGMLLITFLRLLTWVILARVILSWIVRDPKNPLVVVLGTLTDPLLKPLRKLFTFGPVDVSPMVAILILYGLQTAIVRHLGG